VQLNYVPRRHRRYQLRYHAKFSLSRSNPPDKQLK